MSSTARDDRIFKALGHHRRRAILDALKDTPRTTGALCAAFPDLDRCTVMQHLRALEEAELVIVERRGRERWNHLNPLPIRDIHERWIGDYAAFAVEKLAALKSGLEGGGNDKRESPDHSTPTVITRLVRVIQSDQASRVWRAVLWIARTSRAMTAVGKPDMDRTFLPRPSPLPSPP